MKATESIDVMDAVGSAIRIDTRGREVMRILPRNNDAVNEEWISDKTRHVADGLRTQRLDQPYIRVNGKLSPASWDDALALVGSKLKTAAPTRIGAIVGDLAGAEEMFALKDLFTRLGSTNIDCRQDHAKLDSALGRANYVFGTTIEGIEQADCVLLIGTNPRLEAAVLNARILKRWKQGGLRVGLVGENVSLSYPVEHLGAGTDTVQALSEGRHAFSAHLKAAKRPMVIVGPAAYTAADGAALMALARAIAEAACEGADAGWVAFNVLHTAASRVAGLDLGLVPTKGGLDVAGMLAAAAGGSLDVLYLLGADELPMQNLGATFVVYQGSHGDAGANRADVILPGSAYTEKSATYANTEGRTQMTTQAIAPPGLAKDDWAILRALSTLAGQQLPYDTIAALRAATYQAAPQLAALGQVTHGNAPSPAGLGAAAKPVSNTALINPIRDFYLTNPIARASAIMAEMSALKKAASGVRTATRDAAE
jgi:NADH-quinone oxidoreductase subunit G